MKAREYTKETITAVGSSNRSFPEFNIGDTIGAHLLVKEGSKERVQVFQGDVIAIKRNGASSSFTVRKIGAHNIPVERIIPFHSPILKDITVVKRGDVRRAKLYYVRDRVGKAARIKEKREKKADTPEVLVQAVVDSNASKAVAIK